VLFIRKFQVILILEGEKPADEDIEGPYPIVVDQPGGGKGLVVQAYTMGKYLGDINLKFDSNGMVTNYSGNPILLDSTVSEGRFMFNLLVLKGLLLNTD
jgi:2',3'-cyclic-nucleotide 2'-phosphodiesterase (5'-nucleotidase family)